MSLPRTELGNQEAHFSETILTLKMGFMTSVYVLPVLGLRFAVAKTNRCQSATERHPLSARTDRNIPIALWFLGAKSQVYALNRLHPSIKR